MTTDAYKEGMSHYKNSPNAYKNPYPPNTTEWIDFERGYFQGMRRDLVPPPSNFDDSHYYYEVVNGEKKKIKTIAEQEAIDNYRKKTRGE